MKGILLFILILAGISIIFIMLDKMQEESRELFSKLIDQIPSFDGEFANIHKFLFSLAILIFLLGGLRVVFRK